MNRPVTAYLVVAFALLAGVRPGCPQNRKEPGAAKKKEIVRPLLILPAASTDIHRWMKAKGWEAQRGNPRRFKVDAASLTMVSKDDSVAIGLERGFPRDVRRWPKLRFRFRIEAIPTGTDLAKKSGDDAGFRLYVAFDRGKGWFHPPHTIAYAWTENVQPGRVIRSAHFKQLRYLSVGKGLPPKTPDGGVKWITVERDLAADYRKAFPEVKQPVPRLTGILLKCDSNNTGTAGRSAVASVELVRPGGKEDPK